MFRTPLHARFAFLGECDRLKTVERLAPLTDDSRQENSAEHSWHLALALMVLRPHLPQGLDLCRILQMLIVHDLPEIYAGDTNVFDEAARAAAVEKERRAAYALFGQLPSSQRAEFIALWEEFTTCESAEARIANALDRFQPLVQHWFAEGVAWQRMGVTTADARRVLARVTELAPELGAFCEGVVDEAERRGYFESEEE